MEHNDLNSLIVSNEESVILSPHEEEKLKAIRLDNLLKDETIKGIIQDRTERKNFADKLFKFLKWFLIFVLFIILFNGFSFTGFIISDAVLIAILTTTTANIIGIFVFVVRYLFNTTNIRK
jgi:hypothetical protein